MELYAKPTGIVYLSVPNLREYGIYLAGIQEENPLNRLSLQNVT
jgi:hypothetical protein